MKKNKGKLRAEYETSKLTFSNGTVRSQMTLEPRIRATELETSLNLKEISKAAITIFNFPTSDKLKYEFMYLGKDNRPYICNNLNCPTNCAKCRHAKIIPVLIITTNHG